MGSIVSFLEWREKDAPSWESLPSLESVGLEMRLQRDLEVDVFLKTFRRIGEPWLWWSKLVQDKDKVRSSLSNPLVRTYFGYTPGEEEPVSIIQLERMSPQPNSPEASEDGSDCLEVNFFGMAKEHTGKKWGKAMMKFVFELFVSLRSSSPSDQDSTSSKSGCGEGGPNPFMIPPLSSSSRLLLNTCTQDSPLALPFYASMGYSVYAQCVEVVKDPRQPPLSLIHPTRAPHIPLL